jgi:hypothetical protein
MLENFFAGYERKIADLKQVGEMSLMEGKQPLSFGGYRFIANEAIKQCNDFNQSILAHLFLLLCWNLISRCASVSSLMFNHISWEEDAMVIVFPSHKGDKEGKHCSPKHVYANPSNPEICPILAFAIYIWTVGFRRTGAKTTVFGETDVIESRFSKWLRDVCLKNSNELLSMGLVITEIGTHSFRKGISTFLQSIPGGPSAVSIYLRAIN